LRNKEGKVIERKCSSATVFSLWKEFECAQPGFFSSVNELFFPTRRDEVLAADEETAFALFEAYLTVELINKADKSLYLPMGITSPRTFMAYLTDQVAGNCNQKICHPNSIQTPEQLRIFLVMGGWESYRTIVEGEK